MSRIEPPPPPKTDPRDAEHLRGWGFKDSGFRINPSGDVELTGGRYALSGQPLPRFLPWVRGVLDLNISAADRVEIPPPQVGAPLEAPALGQALTDLLGADAVTQEPEVRLRHGHGHSQEEIYAVRHGKLSRAPDWVVYPGSEAEIEALVTVARRHGAGLIPFGGGTNVTDALKCPALEVERRPIVSVDLRRMNRILWIDPENRTAEIQAGAVGRTLLAQLREYGFTLGHEPDSVEFSTLGGWIATRASGMKKNRYGNIEDLVLDVRGVASEGMIRRSSTGPRESVGVDPRLCWFGSEGNFGIITSAVVRLFPLPEVQRYGSVIFPDFDRGLAFMRQLTLEGAVPASVRLVDNLQFQFGQALKPASSGWGARKSALEKWFVLNVKGFDPQKMTAATLVFEGTREEVDRQEQALYRIAKRNGGMKGGSANGERGYQLTYGIAYFRDFVMDHQVLAESFETSVAWSDAAALCSRVKARLASEHQKRNLPGNPFITCRVTQVYPSGVCIYFYYGCSIKGVKHPSEVYAEIERAARDEVLLSGGTLSHHHGVGKLRRGFMPRIMSPALLTWSRNLKAAIDPENLFASGNLP